jgi:O-antigen ligase
VFTFCLPIETTSIGAEVSATRLAGYLFLLMAILNPGVSFRRIPKALCWFGLYLCVYATLGVVQPTALWEEIYARVFTLFQLLVLFWVSYNLLRHPRIARGALLALGSSCALVAALQVTGIAVAPAAEEQRVAAFGQNPNEAARSFAVGLLALTGLACAPDPRRSRYRLLAWPAIAVLGLAILQTSSRGGLLALGAGMGALLLVGQAPRVRLRNAAIAVLVIGLVGAVSYSSEASRQRWEAALVSGNLAHREQLYPNARDMFLEQPLTGWGPAAHLYELGRRTHYVRWADPEQLSRDTHNLFLYVLTATGLLGSLPFLIGLWLCLHEAWRGRGGPEGMLPFALVVAMLIASMGSTGIHLKLLWFVLACGAASGSLLPTPGALVRPARPVSRSGDCAAATRS